jgi:hypothetical protein
MLRSTMFGGGSTTQLVARMSFRGNDSAMVGHARYCSGCRGELF